MGELVKEYFASGLYTVDNLKVFVLAGYISADDFKQLTKTDYVAGKVNATA